MPEEPENLERDLASDFEDWLNVRSEDGIGVRVADLDLMEAIILIRLRSIFTIEQMHERAHAMIVYAEAILDAPEGLIDGDGNPHPGMKVENFEGTQEELISMLNENALQEITDEEISGFFEAEGE